MPAAIIRISAELLSRIQRHLLPAGGLCEEAAFLFSQARMTENGCVLDVVDGQTIPPDGFASRSRFYLELTDATRAAVIKRAHDLGAGLVECHSHPTQRGACFSWSDLHGFDEFVPHVMWRLKGLPYAALVIARDSLDGVFWRAAGAGHEPVHEIVTEHCALRATGLTQANWNEIYERKPL